MIQEHLESKLPGILLEFPEIRLVHLFGSQVTGKTGPMSDLDLAVWVDAPDPTEIQLRFMQSMEDEFLHLHVDVMLLNTVPVEMAFQVISTGRVVYRIDEYTRVEYEANVMSRYGDYLPVLRMFREQILREDAYEKRVERYRKASGCVERSYSLVGEPSE